MSRQINKERTRLRLLEAILKTIQRFGHGTLTTGRIAQLAGVAQPTFYVHFRSMDQALEQVADWVALELGPAFEPELSPERDRAAEVLEQAVFRCTRSLVEDTKVAEVFSFQPSRPNHRARPTLDRADERAARAYATDGCPGSSEHHRG